MSIAPKRDRPDTHKVPRSFRERSQNESCATTRAIRQAQSAERFARATSKWAPRHSGANLNEHQALATTVRTPSVATLFGEKHLQRTLIKEQEILNYMIFCFCCPFIFPQFPDKSIRVFFSPFSRQLYVDLQGSSMIYLLKMVVYHTSSKLLNSQRGTLQPAANLKHRQEWHIITSWPTISSGWTYPPAI